MQLVINTFGASLRKQGNRFLVQAGQKPFVVSAHTVQSILITTAVHLSTDAIEEGPKFFAILIATDIAKRRLAGP